MKKNELLRYDLDTPAWLLEKEKPVLLVRDYYEEDGLMIYKFYRQEDLKKGRTNPFFVIFKDRHTWINYDFESKKWSGASLNHMYNYELYSYYGILENLRKWQGKRMQKRKERQKQREAESTRAVMEKVPELPQDFKTFCEEEVMKTANYLVYSSRRRKVYCTHCKKEYDLKFLIQRNEKKPKHGEYSMCDRCKVEMTAISEGFSRKGRVYRRSTEIIQQYGTGVIVRKFNIYRNFETSLHPETVIEEMRRYVYVNGTERRYEKRYQEEIKRRKWHFVPQCKSFTNLIYAECGNYKSNVKEVLKNSDFAKTGVLEYLKKHSFKIESYERLLTRLTEHPYVEQFVKAGLGELADNIFAGTFYRIEVDKKQTELTKMLNINRQQLRWVRAGKQWSMLEIIQKANKRGKYITEFEAKYYTETMNQYQMERLLFREDINTEKMCRYLKENKIDAGDFADHLQLLEKLGLPKKKQYLYPKDFEQAHQDEIEEDILRAELVSPEMSKAFEKTYSRWKKIGKKVKMEDNVYCILFPENCMEIRVEGRTLHHCVGNYVEKAAKGETVILFMRRKEEPKKALYTMEYKSGKLVQIRGTCNSAPEEKARELAERFAKEFGMAEKEYQLKEKQGGKHERAYV